MATMSMDAIRRSRDFDDEYAGKLVLTHRMQTLDRCSTILTSSGSLWTRPRDNPTQILAKFLAVSLGLHH